MNRAKEEEKRYEWLQAKEYYKQASEIALNENRILRTAEFHDRMGFCYYKSAFQAENKSQFNSRMRLAIGAYEKAANCYRNTNNTKEAVRIDNSRAKIAYVDSWLELDYSKTKKLINKWWNLKTKVLKAYEKADDKLGIAKTCNDMLEGSIACRYYLGLDSKESKSIRDELISLGERAIAILTKNEDEYELARGYCWTSFFCVSNNIVGQEQKTDEKKKGIAYSKKAVKLSQKTEDAWLIGWSRLAEATSAFIENNLNTGFNLFEDVIRQGEISKDAFLSGIGSGFVVVYDFAFGSLEENPEKIRQRHEFSLKTTLRMIQELQKIIVHTWNCYFNTCLAFLGKASVELDIKEKYAFLKKAVEYGRKGVEIVGDWRHSNLPMVLNAYSRALYRLSEIENSPIEKRKLLKELQDNAKHSSMILKDFPSNYYFTAHNPKWIAVVKVELSKLEKNRKKKIEILKDVIPQIEICVKTIKKDIQATPLPFKYGIHGESLYWFGGIFCQLNSLTNEKSFLYRALEVYKDAIALFERVGLVNRVAVAYWRIAKTEDQLGELSKAAENYGFASEAYLKASEKVPQLKEFFGNHALYMQAWFEIEKARQYHSRENYAEAMRHYEKAALLHEESKAWSYLAPNYYAWQQLEKGENYSRKEAPSEAIESFRLAMEYFKKAEESVKTEIESTESKEENKQAKEMIKASSLRSSYCSARIGIEEAKIFDGKGEYNLSSKSYGKSAQILSRILDGLEIEDEKRELRLIMMLSKAWEKMALAEEHASSVTYLEASKLFDQAKANSPSKKTTMLILGNSSFCKGLAAGIEYQNSLDLKDNTLAKRYVKSAAANYLQAGFKHASEYAKATQRLFDAYVFINQAESEVDPENKTKQYQMAEKLLQIAAGSFIKAKQPERTAQVQQMLKTIGEEKSLAATLNEVFHAPSSTSSTLSFAVPTPTSEASIGLEKFEKANVQANIVAGMKEVRVGESFCLTVEFVNAGKEPALLTRVEDFVPPDFAVVKKTEIYRLEESCLNMKGKQIPPLKLVEAKVVLQPSKKGIYVLSPTVHYFDEVGQNKSLKLKSIEIKVEEVTLADRLPTGTKELDSLLLGGIPKEYAVVLTGPPSDERETLINGFVVAGTEEGQTSFHVTTEFAGSNGLMDKSGFYLFLCNPKPKVEVPDHPNVYKIRSKTDLNSLNIALLKSYRNVEPSSSKRICIEIVSDVLVNYGVKTTRKWVSELITDVCSKGFTLMAVMNPGMHPPDQATAVIDLFDGEISLHQTEDPLECKKSIRIKKLRNQDYIQNSICLTKQKK